MASSATTASNGFLASIGSLKLILAGIALVGVVIGVVLLNQQKQTVQTAALPTRTTISSPIDTTKKKSDSVLDTRTQYQRINPSPIPGRTRVDSSDHFAPTANDLLDPSSPPNIHQSDSTRGRIRHH